MFVSLIGGWCALHSQHLEQSLVDRDNPEEVARLRQQAQNTPFLPLVRRYDADYDTLLFLLTKQQLQEKYLLALQATPSSSVLRLQAQKLFQLEIIDQPLFHTIAANSQALQQERIQDSAARALARLNKTPI
ncbi:MAG: hypothetical protein HY069_01880 [Chlamydiia bacterium]|nr:hypothetical protein [Chlamydiia bacterium]